MAKRKVESNERPVALDWNHTGKRRYKKVLPENCIRCNEKIDRSKQGRARICLKCQRKHDVEKVRAYRKRMKNVAAA